MENFMFGVNEVQNFGGVEVRAGYELLLNFMNCKKAILKNSLPLSPPLQQLFPPTSINGTRKPERWEVDGRESNSFKDPKTYLHEKFVRGSVGFHMLQFQ